MPAGSPASVAAVAPVASANLPHVLVRGLGLKRGERWLFRDVSITVPRGRFVAVVGPSGVGKSSFLHCLAGLLPPTEGATWFRPAPAPGAASVEPVALEHYRRRIGVVFQNNLLCPQASVLTNILCGRLARHPWWRTLFGFPVTERRAAMRIGGELALTPHLHRPVGETSGGEQQRAAVARALLQEPELYLADEPVSNLDAYLTGRVMGLLRLEAERQGRTVFCVLHSAELVERFADLALSFDPSDPRGWKLREIRR